MLKEHLDDESVRPLERVLSVRYLIIGLAAAC